MKKLIDFISRHIIWIAIALASIILLKPAIPEFNTLLMILLIESLSLALSGISLWVYSKIDFTLSANNSNIGFIFLGVHICVGLIVVGVYIAQL